MTTHTGGCLCGDVGYSLSGALPDALVCHCSVCRKAFGAVGSYVVWIDPDRFSWTSGEDGLSTYRNAQGFALTFCGRCGTTLGVQHAGRIVLVTLASLNGAPEVKVGQHLFVGSKAPWDEIVGDAPQYETRPPAPESDAT